MTRLKLGILETAGITPRVVFDLAPSVPEVEVVVVASFHEQVTA